MTKNSIIPSRLKQTLISVFLGRGILATRQLLLVSVLIQAWGVNYYGAWLVLSAIPSFLAMSNLGLGTSAHYTIAIDLPAGRKEEAWDTLITALWMILTLGVVAVAGTLFWMYWQQTGSNHTGLIEHSWLVVPLLLGSLFVRMLGQPFYGCWAGLKKPAVANHFVNLLYFGELAVSLSIPLLGGKALQLAFCVFVWTSLWYVFIAFRTFKALQQNSLIIKRFLPDMERAKGLLSVGLGHQLTPLWQAVLFQGSVVLANSALGPAGAALWGTLRMATRSCDQLLEFIGQSIGPEFQLAFGAGDMEKVRKLHAVGFISSFLLSAAKKSPSGPHVFRQPCLPASP
ncbi:MAG: hypothetical protein EOO38_16245 [Cytophagaceae bacterium]|nr:MAG: hypothetical protein EOO38_16245 [Cytophagaceae bacterium]